MTSQFKFLCIALGVLPNVPEFLSRPREFRAINELRRTSFEDLSNAIKVCTKIL